MQGVSQSAPETQTRPAEASGRALAAFAAAALELVRGDSPEQGLRSLARAVALGTGAELVVARVANECGFLVARGVHADSPALTAELAETRVAAAELGEEEREVADAGADTSLPEAVRRAAARAGTPVVRVVPVALEGEVAATLELYGSGVGFGPDEVALARAAAAHVALALRLHRALGAGANRRPELSEAQLELLGEALAAGADETEAAEQIVRVAAEAAEAVGATLWRLESDGPPTLLAAHGFGGSLPDLEAAADHVRSSLNGRSGGDRLDVWFTHTIPLGEPPTAALQLAFDEEAPAEAELDRLSPFAARAALALRRSRRVGLIALALKRSQTLVAVVSQAIAQLSLSHTLETAVERVAELTASGHVAVYLRDEGRLVAASTRGLTGHHVDLAERLLELALGPFRGRGYLFIEDMHRDPRLAGLEDVLWESSIRRALFIPLLVQEEVIGALAVFKSRARPYRDGEEGLLIALSSQLAVAVQNARLHERTKELSAILERTLESERRAARQLRGLYAISQTFAESLSLDATLEAVARTMVELLGVDLAVIRMPDPRSEALVVRAVYVADAPTGELAASLVARPQPLSAPLARRLVRAKRPLLLKPGVAAPEDAERVLEPFLRQGATAAVLPLATPGEVLGTLTLASFDPTRPLGEDDVSAVVPVCAQAALAIDNARLYQQQKDFAETMQRSLLPRELPRVPGLDLGHVYQSSAQVDVGGDLYDFVMLEDGRLAVAIGDVLGKGISAAADMAMTKFSFRVLSRADSEPSAVLRSANDVICDEIEPGKFVTLLYALVDPAAGEVACASAGHPPALVVDPWGNVAPLGSSGLALGIEREQEYPSARAWLMPGSAVVLYTDGVIEARRDGELYGEDRLARLLAERRGLGAQELASAVLADCRDFSGGGLADDCAVVCLKLAR